MKKALKTWTMIALVLILIGGLVFGVGFIVSGGSFKNMSHIKGSAEQTYTETEEVSSVYVKVSTTDLTVEYSSTAEKISVEYADLVTKKGDPVYKTSVEQSGGTLRISGKTYWRKTLLSFFTPSAKIKLIVPAERKISLQVETTTGDIRVQGNAEFLSLNLETNTGDIVLKNAVSVDNNAVITVDTGDIKIGDLAANAVKIEADTGDILLSGKVVAEHFLLEVDTGDVYGLNGVLDAQTIEIEADTGDIKIKLFGKQSDYAIRVKTDTGDQNIHSQTGGERTLHIETDTGDIYVRFEE